MSCLRERLRYPVFLLLIFCFGFNWPTPSKTTKKDASKVSGDKQSRTKTVETAKPSVLDNTKIKTLSATPVQPASSISNLPDFKSMQNLQRQLDDVVKMNQAMKRHYALQASEISRMQNRIFVNQQILREVKVPSVYKPAQISSPNTKESTLSSDRSKYS